MEREGSQEADGGSEICACVSKFGASRRTSHDSGARETREYEDLRFKEDNDRALTTD